MLSGAITVLRCVANEPSYYRARDGTIKHVNIVTQIMASVSHNKREMVETDLGFHSSSGDEESAEGSHRHSDEEAGASAGEEGGRHRPGRRRPRRGRSPSPAEEPITDASHDEPPASLRPQHKADVEAGHRSRESSSRALPHSRAEEEEGERRASLRSQHDLAEAAGPRLRSRSTDGEPRSEFPHRRRHDEEAASSDAEEERGRRPYRSSEGPRSGGEETFDGPGENDDDRMAMNRSRSRTDRPRKRSLSPRARSVLPRDASRKARSVRSESYPEGQRGLSRGRPRHHQPPPRVPASDFSREAVHDERVASDVSQEELPSPGRRGPESDDEARSEHEELSEDREDDGAATNRSRSRTRRPRNRYLTRRARSVLPRALSRDAEMVRPTSNPAGSRGLSRGRSRRHRPPPYEPPSDFSHEGEHDEGPAIDDPEEGLLDRSLSEHETDGAAGVRPRSGSRRSRGRRPSRAKSSSPHKSARDDIMRSASNPGDRRNRSRSRSGRAESSRRQPLRNST